MSQRACVRSVACPRRSRCVIITDASHEQALWRIFGAAREMQIGGHAPHLQHWDCARADMLLTGASFPCLMR